MTETSGFDEVQRNLEALTNEVQQKSDDGSGEVTLDKLLPDSFIQAHTRFQSLNEMSAASGIKSAEEIHSPEWSTFVAENSDFDGWESMFAAAGREYAFRELSF